MQRLGTKGGDDNLNAEIPLGRMGKISDIASMAVFLFSEEASWISGQVFVVDGGAHRVSLTLPSICLSRLTLLRPPFAPLHPPFFTGSPAHSHTFTSPLPYPQAVLDPQSVMDKIRDPRDEGNGGKGRKPATAKL